MRTLVWFRRNLRTHDNHVLTNACDHALKSKAGAGHARDGVVGLFVISPSDYARHKDAPAKIDLILRTLAELSASLARLNIPLLIRTAKLPRDVAPAVAKVASEVQAGKVFVDAQYELHECAQDDQAEELLKAADIGFAKVHDAVLMPPGEVMTNAGGPYTVFTPFKKMLYNIIESRGGVGTEAGSCIRVAPVPGKQAVISILPDPVPTMVAGFESPLDPTIWPAGESFALARLEEFSKNMRSYKDRRDFPSLDATSRLSPYLTIGAISPRVCLQKALSENKGQLMKGSDGHVHWISEVVWREFYKHVLVHFPRVCRGLAFKPDTDQIQWAENEIHFQAWCDGRTGVPIVDAAMRQLSGMGWMHNRLRMVAAMYLTKDLFLNWRLGEAWFMKHLVDGDLAQNNGGWQWSASTGTDAAPYFRIFNPYMQSEKFDTSGTFIRKWVPELAACPTEFIHAPHEAPLTVRAKLDYPMPIVDRTKSKDRVMAAFRAIGQLPELER